MLSADGAQLPPSDEAEWSTPRGGLDRAGPRSRRTSPVQKTATSSPHKGGGRRPTPSAHDILGNVWEYALEFHDAPNTARLRGGCWSSRRASSASRTARRCSTNGSRRTRTAPQRLVADEPDGLRGSASSASRTPPTGRSAGLPGEDRGEATGTPRSRSNPGSTSPWRTVTARSGTGGPGARGARDPGHYLETDGRRTCGHLGREARRATFTKAWPVLANSALEGRSASR